MRSLELLSGHAALAAARLPPGGVGRSYPLHAASASTTSAPAAPWPWLYGWGGKGDGTPDASGAVGATCLDLGWSGAGW